MLIESQQLELKREYTEDVKKTIIAFANTQGGELLIGVCDDGSVAGLQGAVKIQLQVSNAVRDAIQPDVTMFCRYDIKMMEGKEILSVHVQRGTDRPYYLAVKGISPVGVYVRQGASTVPASKTAIVKMIRETSGDSYEDARSLRQDLTFEKTSAFFGQRQILFGLSQQKTLHVIGEDNTYTNLALLLSDQCPHSMKLAQFEGSSKTVFKDRREINGSLLQHLEDGYDFIDRLNRTRAEIRGLYRIDMRDYPPDAVREALLNAIVHKDYSISASTLVSLFDDRMEIVTIGGLVNGISMKDVLMGVSMLRNQSLANVFYRLKLIEAYGTGMLTINNSYMEYAVKPRIEVSENAFKITLPNTNFTGNPGMAKSIIDQAPAEASDREKQVLRLFDKSESIVRKDVEKTLGISQTTAIGLLRIMTAKGLLIKAGQGKAMAYLLNGKI